MSWENCDGTPKIVGNHRLQTGKGVVCLLDLEVPSGLYVRPKIRAKSHAGSCSSLPETSVPPTYLLLVWGLLCHCCADWMERKMCCLRVCGWGWKDLLLVEVLICRCFLLTLYFPLVSSLSVGQSERSSHRTQSEASFYCGYCWSCLPGELPAFASLGSSPSSVPSGCWVKSSAAEGWHAAGRALWAGPCSHSLWYSRFSHLKLAS